MKAISVILLMIFIGCQNSINPTDKSSIYYEFYFDNERGVYALEKFDQENIQIDTAFLYRDSLRKDLIELNTIVRKGNYPTINQIIHYKKYSDRVVDTSNSYFYNLSLIDGDSIELKVISQYNDTIYLEIGEIGANYENIGRVDSFALNEGYIKLELKDYYHRARVGVWSIRETKEGITYGGKDLYVPQKFLSPCIICPLKDSNNSNVIDSNYW